MGAAGARSRLGMAAFRIRHRCSSLLGLNVFLLQQLFAQPFEGAPAVIHDRGLARATLVRAVCAARGAETETALVTQWLHRDRELNLLQRKLPKGNGPFRVKLDVELFLVGDLDLLVLLGGLGT